MSEATITYLSILNEYQTGHQEIIKVSKREPQHTMGKGGECICPKCNTSVPHERGVPCQDERCPKCSAKMLRVGSEHHALWLKKNRSPASDVTK